MKDTNQIIQEVLQRKFKTLLYEELNLKSVLFQILTEGTAYIIGGYVRDVIENKENRDLDIVVDIPNERLRNIVESENCEKRYNRMGGAKLILKNINVDIWSFDNNWAFKNGLVKLNEKEKLNSLAKGCFYNYDALVVNVSNFSYNIRYYEKFVEKKVGISYTDNLKDYIYRKMLSLNDIYGDVTERLLHVKKAYHKYELINREDIIHTFEKLRGEYPQTLFG